MIKNKENSEYYIWSDCCESWILNDSENLSVKLEKMPPSSCEQQHFHKLAEHVFFIKKGTATFCIDDEYFEVPSGSGIAIEPNQRHYVVNNTLGNLEFLVISQPNTKNDRFSV